MGGECKRLRVIEQLFFPHSQSKRVVTILEAYAQLTRKGRAQLKALDGIDLSVIFIPAAKENLNWLLAENLDMQIALADFSGTYLHSLSKTLDLG